MYPKEDIKRIKMPISHGILEKLGMGNVEPAYIPNHTVLCYDAL